jgi:hypothetical protein
MPILYELDDIFRRIVATVQKRGLSRAARNPRRFAVPLFRMCRQESAGGGIGVFDLPAVPTAPAAVAHHQFSDRGKDAEGCANARALRTRRDGVSHVRTYRITTPQIDSATTVS